MEVPDVANMSSVESVNHYIMERMLKMRSQMTLSMMQVTMN